MNSTNIRAIPEEEWFSPNRRYQLFRKSLSLAVGGVKDTGDWGGGHPFDVELARLPPGKSNFPLHSHSSQTELYLIINGSGKFHSDEQTKDIGEGDVLHCPPGQAHRIENDGDIDLVFYVIADNPKVDICTYPETGKLFIKPDRKCILPTTTKYFEPED